jgi:LDH2 family malate/lactate/ureidoglycolate dehydrogenase
MAGVDGGILFPAERLRGWTQEVFQKVGVSEEDTTLLTDSLIEANLRGVDTHGITQMLCVYVERLRKGVMNAKSNLVVVREKSSTVLIDCNNSIGQVGAERAMRMAVEKARQTGVALAAVTHSNHYGMAAYWAMMALPHGMIGFSATNATAAVAPTGGCTAPSPSLSPLTENGRSFWIWPRPWWPAVGLNFMPSWTNRWNPDGPSTNGACPPRIRTPP